MNRLASGYFAASVRLLLAACTMGPDYQRPEVPVPDAYQDVAVSRRFVRQP